MGLCSVLSSDSSCQLLPKVEDLHSWGGGQLLLRFALQNGGASCATIQGACCSVPPPKESHPFVGGRGQALQLEAGLHKSSSRRRNSSRFSSSSIVRNMAE